MTTEMIVSVDGLPQIHGTPLARVSISGLRVSIEVDDDSEGRMRLIFEPYQAVRVTTADCFEPPGDLSRATSRVVEVVKSSWVEALRRSQRVIDETATFLDKSRHFLVPLQDEFAEVVAWDVRFERLEHGNKASSSTE